MNTTAKCAGFGVGMTLAFGCSASTTAPHNAPADASVVDAASDARRETGALDPFNGDCKSARWANVSDACWSCYCSKCEKSLDQCGDACFQGLQCGIDNHVAAGVAADLACELRAYTADCDSNPVIKAASSAVTSFDVCLIGSHDPATEMIRACEAACGTTYTGDVCQRFPASSSDAAACSNEPVCNGPNVPVGCSVGAPVCVNGVNTCGPVVCPDGGGASDTGTPGD